MELKDPSPNFSYQYYPNQYGISDSDIDLLWQNSPTSHENWRMFFIGLTVPLAISCFIELFEEDFAVITFCIYLGSFIISFIIAIILGSIKRKKKDIFEKTINRIKSEQKLIFTGTYTGSSSAFSQSMDEER